MRKSWIAVCTAVAMVFTMAVGLCMQVLLRPQAVSAFAKESMKIVLDAGHGGIDGGVVGKKTGIKESDINLQITYALKSVLEDMGFEVVLTRKTGEGLYGTTAKGFKKRDMQKRKEIILQADPALVISIHQNLYPSQNSRGGQVFYRKEDGESQALALALQDSLNGLYQEEGVKSRKASQGEFFILNCHTCPSVIVECGFLSNAADEKLLTQERGQKHIAESIAKGVLVYFSKITS
ncbi:MAG: N-acetylmuramoyl-L-alanine amidase [Clostridia bacterium]|nr:N-acetylmuramoyl-L-alanine amidase [Clostridia bacterium]